MNEVDSAYLSPTDIIDSEHPLVAAYAESALQGAAGDPVSQAVRLYYAVRDPIWYDPYVPFYLPEHYRASYTLRTRRAYCVGKAALLCALARACGIASRIGFADVRNHLATRQLLEFLGTDLFVYHGYTEFYLNGRWVKATPAFNRELCQKHHVIPLEFNGHEDSIFHPYNLEKKKFMEYVSDRGTCADIPVEEIVAAWKTAYGKARVNRWIENFERVARGPQRNFDAEEVL
jgi:transglutaminase-like putative cysteine protease